ncbi:MAG: hypothetical protein PHX60_15905 [Giesbergeria sp.]|uniref:hypothetical protein n=1 Tax=Giesbergeria sp. TaxID=2818473 RepID=UPI002636D2EA|nr:hypothetical protein [Giesbergeria sp.]MDD2611135.1 hypothetical protein [Giesbergeria sp.]
MLSNYGLGRVLCFISLTLGANLSLAQDIKRIASQQASQASAPRVVLPAGITEEMLAPPPVPSFMLKPTEKPLSVDDMVQQAREAEKKAGIKPTQKPAN